MGRGKGFELIPRAVPPRRMSSSGFYRQIVDEFIKSGEKSVLIGGTDRKPATLVQSLRKVVESEGLSDIAVVQRSGEVYITRGRGA